MRKKQGDQCDVTCSCRFVEGLLALPIARKSISTATEQQPSRPQVASVRSCVERCQPCCISVLDICSPR